MKQPSAIWHPMTQHAIFNDSVFVERAQGAYLYTQDGRKIIDGISSWWVNTHGHCHPKIVKAVQEQAGKMEQVIFAGFTHEPAEALTQKLMSITDPSLEFVFYSDSGSTAIEIALKMALGYFEQTSGARRKIVALDGGYHGDTFGMMSMGSRSVFNKLYEPYLFDVTHLPFPSEGEEQACLQAFEDYLIANKGDVAALILEPLVQGAAGMRVYSAGVLKGLHDLCRVRGTLLIADEVMTGFGRTGSMFACEQAGIAPDLLCLSKGITGGFLPMGATLATRDIYMAFYHEDRSKTFFHSTSFTGNALSCAAALAALEIWDEEPVMERIATISASHAAAGLKFSLREDVSAVRHKGSILALDVVDQAGGYLSTLGPTLYNYFLDHDVLLRPIGNCIYILPPYCVSEGDLNAIYDCVSDALDHVRDSCC